MPHHARKRSAATGPRRHADQSEAERKQQVLSHVAPSFTAPIADAVVIKSEGLFFLTNREGDVPLQGRHGLGLYYHDCRYLDGYELRVNGGAPQVLAATASEGTRAVLELTNPGTKEGKGASMGGETMGIRWERALDGTRLTLTDRISIRNLGQRATKVVVTLAFRSRFEDIFVVRGMLPARSRRRLRHEWSKGTLVHQYRGLDDVTRSTSMRFSPRPNTSTATTATWRLTLGPRESVDVTVAISLSEHPDADEPAHIARQSAETRIAPDAEGMGHVKVDGDDPDLGRLLDRSLADLRMLRTSIGGAEFFAAGVPWFVTLFGRDSIVTSLQTLAFDSSIAEQTLRLLARYQGTQVDAWREEQPGKILHELRVDELTRANLIPYSPYYGTIDATVLFLILVARHEAWTGSLELFDELREHIELALAWIGKYGDLGRDGYVAYDSKSRNGTLINQGWKDSGDAIVNADGSLAVPPIALVEVQAYVYKAKREMAELYRQAGEPARAGDLEREAKDLRARFDRDFWNEGMGTYVLALQRDNRPAAVVSSNPGHALWCDIAEPAKARRTMERLLRDDMFSGWGIRTLAT
ncbi:MAG: glycogen debranching N-terminal domain-containing protein, partial [Gemmatimonadales bacterium]